MGCWNETCAVSNLHITYGTPVVVFVLLENRDAKSFTSTNALNDLCPLPFYGEYDDYGRAENCHGFGLNLIIEAIRDQLYEFGQGANSFHDFPVNKKNFDLEMMFNADARDRLGIHQTYRWDQTEHDLRSLTNIQNEKGLTESQKFELDRLSDKIKKVDTFRRVSPILVHGEIFKDIMEKWYIDDYVGRGAGNMGYENSYRRIYFKDIVSDIPAHLDGIKKQKEALAAAVGPEERLKVIFANRDTSYNHPNLTTRWLKNLEGGESMNYGLIYSKEVMQGYEDTDNWEHYELFLKEMLTTFWMNAFMNHSRKLWSKQTTSGGQDSSQGHYRLLMDSMTRILDEEKREYDENQEEDEDDDVS